MGEGEGGMFQENSIKTCILSRVKQITSRGWMHETSARTWCTGKTQRDLVEREVGGGIGMGNTCVSMADSCQCMTKSTTKKKKKGNWGFPGYSVVKNPPAKAGDMSLILGSGRFPGEGNDNLF